MRQGRLDEAAEGTERRGGMILPCTTCKYRTVEESGFRIFIGCSDKEKEKGFRYDDFLYHHKCSNYEEETEIDETARAITSVLVRGGQE